TRLTILQMLLDLEKSGKGILTLLPDLIASVFKLPRLDLSKAMRELIQHTKQDKELGRAWARRLIHDSRLSGMVAADQEALVVEEIAERLDDLYDNLLEALEKAVQERVSVFDRLFFTLPDDPGKRSSSKK
ncbi:MAG TPA: hypothetical protein PLB81_13325, partial [Deltaproteobacteria bacterium]|nr:hypothetical protein [Deltaproteobacteria bacterium]